MKRTSALAVFAALTTIATTAWACPPSAEESWIIAIIVAPFLAIPYTLFGTAVIAAQARSWFERPLRGWLFATLGAWLACTVGGAIGFGVIAAFSKHLTSNLEGAIVLSTPLVFEIAYLMWLHARRKNASVDPDAE